MRIPPTLRAALVLLAIALSGTAFAEDDTGGLSILVYGASGKVGHHIVGEALARGHRVTGVSRDPARITLHHERLETVRGDILDPAGVAALTAGHDIVVVSVRGVTGDRPEDAVSFLGTRNVAEVLRQMGAGAPRLIHVGGAASLQTETGGLLADRLPKIFLPKKLELEMAGQVLVLGYLRNASGIEWTYITPPRSLTGGKRRGEYRVGGDRLMEDSHGKSAISRADFAVAVIDEAENVRHRNRRFSVAY